MINLNILKVNYLFATKLRSETIKRTLTSSKFLLKNEVKYHSFSEIKPSKIRKVIAKAQKKELNVLGKKMSSILGKFAIENRVKIWSSGVSKKSTTSCCDNEGFSFVYSHSKKDKRSSGRMNICCQSSLEKEILRVTNVIQREKKTDKEIYFSSYNGIRGSVGHIIFQAFLGKNEWRHIRESHHIKESSLLKEVKRNFSPCSPEVWDNAIDEFSKESTQEKIEKIIKLYSPLYRNNIEIVKKMAEEINSYLSNLPEEWIKEEIRIVDTHVGICDLMIGDKLVDFKFEEKKFGIRKKNFEQLYRYYRSACELNPEEINKIKYLVSFSPITKEIHQLTVDEADKKWKLEENYQEDFRNWQMNNIINIGREEKTKNLKRRIKKIKFEEEKIIDLEEFIEQLELN